MATTRKKVVKDSPNAIAALQDRMGRLQKDAEALLRKTQKQAASLITKDQRKALDRLLGQATRLRDDLEKRAERAAKDLEARAERVRMTLEKEVSKRIDPLLRRLDLPSRKEIQALTRRVTQLERSMGGRKSSVKTAHPPAESSQIGDSGDA
jgi:F0F1-type ATP synthase membrane subunit b/b'